MERVIGLIVGLVLFPGTLALGQISVSPTAKLVRRIELAGSGSNTTSEIGIDLGGVHARGLGDSVAIRVCSKQPMALALATSAASPKAVAQYLIDFYGYSPERVIILRSEDCLGPNPSVTATEFWAVPKGASPPPSIESVKSCQVLIDPLGAQGFPERGQAYKNALQKVPSFLRERPRAVGVILGYYFRHPGSDMRRKLVDAGKFLQQSGIPRDRYFVQLMPWTGEYSVSYPKPRYPTVLVFEITEECRTDRSGETKTRSNIVTQGFDSYGDLSWQEEKAHLDNFAIALQHDPKLIGNIIVYAGRRSCANEAKSRLLRAKNYLVQTRGIPESRLKRIDGGYREELTVVLQPVPAGAPEITVSPTLQRGDVRVLKRCKRQARPRSKRRFRHYRPPAEQG